jgi:hypothetical protein
VVVGFAANSLVDLILNGSDLIEYELQSVRPAPPSHVNIVTRSAALVTGNDEIHGSARRLTNSNVTIPDDPPRSEATTG